MRIFLLLSLVFSYSVFANDLDFFYGAKKVKSLKSEKLKNLKKVEVYNPFRQYKKQYYGTDFAKLLASVYGAKWKKAATIKFVAIDGFIQMAEIPKFLKESEKHKGILAVGEDGKKTFTPFDKKGKMIDPGPYYLVWTGFDETWKADYNHDLKWPYQLKSIIISP